LPHKSYKATSTAPAAANACDPNWAKTFVTKPDGSPTSHPKSSFRNWSFTITAVDSDAAPGPNPHNPESVDTFTYKASRFRMVRSPPWNGSRTGSGMGQDKRKARTSVIFINFKN
jgi:hypothetical protein